MILSDDSPPGGGHFFEPRGSGDHTFDQAIINAKGLIAFVAIKQRSKTNREEALFCGRPGSIEQVACVGEGLFAYRSLGNGRIDASGFHPVQLSDSGNLIFRPKPGTSYLGWPEWANVFRPWYFADGRATSIRAAGADPMVLSSRALKTFVSSDGTIVVLDVEENRPFSLWSGRNTKLSRVIKAGDAAPGAGEGVSFRGIFGDVRLAPNGTLILRVKICGKGVTDRDDSGIWSGPPGKLRAVAMEGDTIPGSNGNEVYGDFSNAPMAVNSDGRVAFIANERLFAGAPEDLKVVANRNVPPVGTNNDATPYLQYDARLAMSDDGIISLVESRGIWIGSANGWERYSWENDVSNESKEKGRYKIESLCLTEKRFATCTAQFDDGTKAVLAGRPGGLRVIAKSGDEIEVRPGDRRRIAPGGVFISFVDGLCGLPMNDHGDVLVRLSFLPVRGKRDISEGLFVFHTGHEIKTSQPSHE